MHQQTPPGKRSKNAMTMPVKMSLGGKKKESEKEDNLAEDEYIK